MIGRMIQELGSVVYRHPSVPQDIPGTGPFGRLKIALLADYFTTACLSAECRVRSLTPDNYRDVICNWRPDLVFVESAFHGVQGEWRYKLAKQPKYIRMSRPRTIPRLVQLARDRGIPAVFWNKDDGAFFDAFIDVARLFPYVFTTDNTCVPRYKTHLPGESRVEVLAMPYQPAFHNFTGFAFERNEACFVGSYYRKILNSRRRFLDMLFSVCEQTAMPLHVFDRNSNRLSHFFEFRYPHKSALRIHDKVPYTETAAVYKQYAVSLNVNSVTDSETMCSRRLLEILACGGILVTNSSPVVEKLFRDYCHVVTSADHARELLLRFSFGPSAEDKDRAEAGAGYVRKAHTWHCRLEQMADSINF